jgi:hypothetical protein
MQLSSSNGNSRKFSVTKGNYTPKQYKDNWLELDFDEESLVFTTEGVWSNISTSTPMVQGKKQRDYSLFLESFPPKGLSFLELSRLIMGYYNVSSATASRVIKEMHQKGLITLVGRTYQLSSLSNDKQYDDSDSNDSDCDENDCDDDEPGRVSDDDIFD